MGVDVPNARSQLKAGRSRAVNLCTKSFAVFIGSAINELLPWPSADSLVFIGTYPFSEPGQQQRPYNSLRFILSLSLLGLLFPQNWARTRTDNNGEQQLHRIKAQPRTIYSLSRYGWALSESMQNIWPSSSPTAPQSSSSGVGNQWDCRALG